MPTEKILLGKISLTTGVYEMKLPVVVNPTLLNGLATVQLEEVYIDCDTTAGPVDIILPTIAQFNYNWQAKIYITDISIAGTNPITIAASGGNTIGDATTHVISNNKETNYLHIVSDNNWMCLSNAGGGGAGGYEDILYADLYTKIVNGELVPTQKYRLLNYKSVNFINGWDTANNNPPASTNFDPNQIITGPDEILLLEAITNYELNPVALSESNPGDIIEFQAYTNAIGSDFDIYTGQTLPDSTTVVGFDLQWDGTNVYFDMPSNYPALFGQYFYLYAEFYDGSNYYYQDGTFEPLTPGIAVCQYPYSAGDPYYGYLKQMSRLSISPDGLKVIMLDLKYNDYLNYQTSSLYVDTVYKKGDAFGWITRRTDTEKNISIPFDFRHRVYRRFEVEAYGTLTGLGYTTSASGLPNGVFWDINGNTTSGNGSGAIFKVTITGGSVSNVQIQKAGRFYQTTSIITIYGSQIGGISGIDDITITPYINSQIGYYAIGNNFYGEMPSSNYEDFKSVPSEYYYVFDIQWDGIGGPNSYWYCGYSDNNVLNGIFAQNKLSDYTLRNTIDGGVNRNTCLGQFSNNYIIGGFYDNIIKISMDSNTMQYSINNEIFRMSSNVIGPNFIENFITNLNSNFIGYNFSNNNSFGDFILNNIGEGFSRNTVLNFFNNNYILDGFIYNSIDNEFLNNKISPNYSYNNIGNNFKDNKIQDIFYRNNVGENFLSNVLGGEFSDNVIGDIFTNNITLGYFQFNKTSTQFANNTSIGNNFNRNEIGSSFTNNTLIGQNFIGNKIGNNFTNNSSIDDEFRNNVIGDFFQDNPSIGQNFRDNHIGNNFSQNVSIRDNFNGNNIGNNFFANTLIGENFLSNQIGNDFSINNIDDGFKLNVIGNLFNTNTTKNNFNSNVIGNNFYNNIDIGSSFQGNKIGDYFQNNSTIGNDFQNNTIGNNFQTNSISATFEHNNIGDLFNTNTIGSNFANNVIGVKFSNNSIANIFTGNKIGNDFDLNIIGTSFIGNVIGNEFQGNGPISNNFNGNHIGNNFGGNLSIGIYFSGNLIGNNFNGNLSIGNYFSNNRISENFLDNVSIGNDFILNVIDNEFSSNTVGNLFNRNIIACQVISVDFSLATYVYGNFNCNIFLRSDSTTQLSIVDNTNTVQYYAINA